jgi:ubiquinone/menaquinone biosynthesis C-methylase UbiE
MTGERMDSGKQIESVRAYWNSRASLGQSAGTQDLILKELELKTIAEFVRPGMKILDAGCGNGVAAIELARRFPVDVTGVDYAAEMVKAAAQTAATAALLGTIQFQEGDLTNISSLPGGFDFVYTERAIINLPDWETQRKAITELTGLLRPGGVYAMLENSQDGLDEINVLRQHVGLVPVVAPWHNRYLKDSELRGLSIPGATLEKVIFYSSTYYFLSRVVNASLAAREGKEPEYDSPVNQLALQLPAIGGMGQSRAWVWKRVTPTRGPTAGR